MPDWSTYRLEDFLLFSPRTYYRLFELHNAAVWPGQVLALAAAVWFHLRIDVDAEHGRMRENSRTPGWVKTAIASSPMAIIASTARRARAAVSGSTSTAPSPVRSVCSSFAGVIIFM